MNNSKFF